MALTDISPYVLTQLFGLKAGLSESTATGDVTVDETYGNLIKIDPGGSARNVTLPAETGRTGVLYWIFNGADAAENLVVKDSGGTTKVTINQNESAIVYCTGSSYTLVAVVAIALS